MSEPYQLTLFAEDSPAKICHSQEEAQGSTGSKADSGLSITASLRKPGRRGSSSKTSRPFDLADWTECSGRSLRSGMMRNGIVYPLQPLVRLTVETESGLWPTPCARAWRDNGKSPSELARHTKTLATHAGGPLNPTWVEWLMGFPVGWTELNNSGTPSSRKSLK